MAFFHLLLMIAIQTAVGGTAFYLGGKVTKDPVTFPAGCLIALGAALCGLIPFIGWVIGWGVMLYLLKRWSECEVWPSGVLLVFVAGIIQMVIEFFLNMARLSFTQA